MSIYDFITQDEIDDLPDDEGPRAFAAFVAITQASLSRMKSGTPDTEDASYEREALEREFMALILAASRKYAIEPFASMDVPPANNKDWERQAQFTADLNFYMTQLVLNNSAAAKRDSVLISQVSKEKITDYVRQLRESIAKSGYPPDQQASLNRTLDQFERELVKKRLHLLAVTRLTLELAVIPGGLMGSGIAIQQLLGNVWHVVGEAKAHDETNRPLPLMVEPAPITLPRRNEPERKTTSVPAFEASGGDDDIPF